MASSSRPPTMAPLTIAEVSALLHDAPSNTLKRIGLILSAPDYWRKNHGLYLTPRMLRDDEYMTKLLKVSRASVREKVQRDLVPFKAYLLKDRTVAPPLIELPRELRDIIIKFTFHDIPQIIPPNLDFFANSGRTKTSTPLLRVCRQLYYEAAEALYANRTVWLDDADDFPRRAQHKQFVRRFVVTLDAQEPLNEAVVRASRRDRKMGFRVGSALFPLTGGAGGIWRWANAKGETYVKRNVVGTGASVVRDEVTGES